MIVVSRQVRYDTTVRSTGLRFRQLGDQELDITLLAAPITKYAVMAADPASIHFHLEKALRLAIRKALSDTGPRSYEVMLDLEQSFAPKLTSRRLPDGRMVSSPLDDLYPFLSREELAENVLIPMMED